MRLSQLARLSLLILLLPIVASARIDDDRFWSDRYASPGANGPIKAVAGHDGKLYVAGSFTLIGGTAARNVAVWDGGQWLALGEGIVGEVNDIDVTDDGSVYVALGYGAYAAQGRDTIHAIARWDGARWSHPAEEPRYVIDSRVVPASVTSIAAMGNRLVVAGRFNELGNVTVPGIGVLDGGRWSPLITAPDTAFAETPTVEYAHGRLVVAGSLYRIGGRETRMAIFDGVRWSAAPEVPHTSAIGRYYTSFLTEVAIGPDAIYAGGRDVDAKLWLAKLENGAWRSLGDDPANAPIGLTLNALALHEGNLYVGGEFTEVGNGIEAYNLARWNGEYWSRVGDGVRNDDRNAQGLHDGNQVVNAIEPAGEGLFVGGVFSRAGDLAASGIARWDGKRWATLIGGSNTSLFALARFDGRLFAGGGARAAAGRNVAAPYVAVVDTLIPATIAPQMTPGVVRAMGSSDRHLYFGGDLGRALTLGYAENAVRWDGTVFGLLDAAGRTGVNGPVHAIAIDGRNVFIGGSFTMAGPISVRNLVRWDGTNFHAVGGGVNGTVRALANHGGVIYVGGEFDSAGTTIVANVARFNGEAWSDLGGGVDGPVHALAFDRETLTLYAGGTFENAGGSAARSLAMYSEERWYSPGPVDGPVHALLVADAGVYVGGHFEHVGTVAANGIARLAPERWESLGSGINGPVHALALHDGSLFAAGSFTRAGGNPSFNIARWNGPVAGAETETTAAVVELRCHPNPAGDATTVSFALPTAAAIRLTLADALGRTVRTLLEGSRTAERTALPVDLSGIPPGVYHVRLETSGIVSSARLILVR